MEKSKSSSAKGVPFRSVVRKFVLGENGKETMVGILSHKTNAGVTAREWMEQCGHFTQKEITEFCKKHGFEK